MQLLKPSQPAIQGGHPLAQSLSSAWPMAENGGGLVANLRNGFGVGTLTGGATWRDGESGPEVLLNGSGRRISLPQFTSTISPPFSMIVSAVADTVPTSTAYAGLVALRGSADSILITCGNAAGAGRLAPSWTAGPSEYDANSGLIVSAGVPFTVAMSVSSSLISMYMYDRVSGGKIFTLSGTYTTRTLSGGAEGWNIGNDGNNTTARRWPGAISHVEFLQRGIPYSEFISLVGSADPFGLYRPRLQRRALGLLR